MDFIPSKAQRVEHLKGEFAMVSIVYFILIVYGIFVGTWALYVASMQFRHFKDKLHPVAKAHAYLIGGVMVALDFVVNILISIPLLELPRWDQEEFLLSPRLKRWNRKESNEWRTKVAAWICEHLLNQFDHSGDHC